MGEIRYEQWCARTRKEQQANKQTATGVDVWRRKRSWACTKKENTIKSDVIYECMRERVRDEGR